MGAQDRSSRAKASRDDHVKKGSASKNKSARFGSATWEHTQLNRSICEIADRGDSNGLLSFIQTKNGRMSLVNLSTAIHRLARLAGDDGRSPSWNLSDTRFKTLTTSIKTKVAAIDSQASSEDYVRCLSTLAWAFGRLQEYDPELMQMLSGLAIKNLGSFKSFELINLLWGFAKLQLNQVELFQAAQEHILAHVTSFSSRCLSMAAWSYATTRAQHGCVRLLKRIAEAFVQNLDVTQEKPVSIANLAWALATSGVHPKQDVVRSMGDAALQLLYDFKANELSITLWAFARMSCFHAPLFAAALDRLASEGSLQDDVHPQGITNILFAFARFVEVSDEASSSLLAQPFGGLVPICTRLFPRLSPTEVSSVVASLTKLEAFWGLSTDVVRFLLSLVCSGGSWSPEPDVETQSPCDALVDQCLRALAPPETSGHTPGVENVGQESLASLDPAYVELSWAFGQTCPCGCLCAPTRFGDVAYVCISDPQSTGTVEVPPGLETVVRPAVPTAGQAISLSVIPEFSDMYGEFGNVSDSKEGHPVCVAVDIDTLAGHPGVMLSMEVSSADCVTLREAFILYAAGLYKLSLPACDGAWQARFAVQSFSGAPLGEPLVLHFEARQPGSPASGTSSTKVSKSTSSSPRKASCRSGSTSAGSSACGDTDEVSRNSTALSGYGVCGALIA